MTQRRRPTQARSRATWEAIVEAAAQILERQGEAALTTNAIAERAGVSIGTLYQYFPDKHAVLAAAARRELGAAQTLRPRQRALLTALISAFERLGGASQARVAPSPRPQPARSRRLPSNGWAKRWADLLAEILIGPAPAMIPIRVRRHRRD